MAIGAWLESAPNAEVQEHMLQGVAYNMTAMEFAASNGHERAIQALLQSAPNQQVQEQMCCQSQGTAAAR
eukprot:2282403-Prorocentrum_lima.AAC.1